MNAPSNAGSIYYNYKHTHSIVLMAICDGNYKFIYIDVGANGRISDGGVFNKCSFAMAMDDGILHLPKPQPLPGRDLNIPSVIVADDAFALKPNIMKPYPGRDLGLSQRVFNYRLSRARRCIENTFGIMSARFRLLRAPISLNAAKTRKVTLACCVLHNFLITRNGANYTQSGESSEESLPEENLFPLEPIGEAVNDEDNVPHIHPNNVREELEAYFMSKDGSVGWQFQQI